MTAVSEGAFALQGVEEMFGVAPLSDADLMSTEGGLVWWAAVGIGGGAALVGLAAGVALYCLIA